MSARGSARPPRMAEWLLGRRLGRAERPLVLGDLEEEFHERRSGASAAGARLWYWREVIGLAWGLWWWEPRARPRWRQVMAMDDVRYAVRRLRRRPVAAIVSVITLACAIGASAAAWSLVSAALLNPLRVAAPDRLVQVGFRRLDSRRQPAVTQSGYTYPAYLTLRQAVPIPFAAWGTIGSSTPVLIDGAGDPERPRGVVFANHNFLDILGLPPTLGRFFSEDEDRRGAPLVAVLSERFWRLELDSDPGVVGRVIRVRDHPVHLVGVGPRGFRGLTVSGAPSLFMPLHAIDRIQPYEGLYGDRPPLHWVDLVARLPPGVAAETMQARLNALHLDLAQDRTFVLTDVQTAALSETARVDVRTFSRLLGATVGLLLAIGSLTVGMLLVLRTESRRGELAMCLALGASRVRLAAGVALEGLVLAAAGALLSLPVSLVLFAGIRAFELPGGIRVDRLELALDGRVLAAAAAAAAVSVFLMAAVAYLFGIRQGLGSVLRAHAGGTPRVGRRGSRAALVTAQVAVTLVLVIGTGLFARSVLRALALNPAIDESRLVAARLNLESFGYDAAGAAAFVDELRTRLMRHPAIAAVGFLYGSTGGGVLVDGQKLDPSPSVAFKAIDRDYFDAVGLRVSAGRGFTADDRLGAPHVALVSEALARRIAGEASPLGRRIAEAFEGGPPAEIVGVVPGIRSVGSLDPMVMYRPLAQSPPRPVPPNRGLSLGRELTFRATGDVNNAIGAASSAIREMDPGIRVDPMMSEEARAVDRMAPQRFAMTVMGAFGAIALFLSALGAYVLAESTATERRRELGIRAALGARGGQLRSLMLGETLRLVGGGLLLGFVLSWLGAGTIRAFLFQVDPLDPVVVVAAVATIAVLATVVSLRPVLAASRIDLARVLRDD